MTEERPHPADPPPHSSSEGGSDKEPFELEPEEPATPPRSESHSPGAGPQTGGDVCPQCGATIDPTSAGEPACLRCGFDPAAAPDNDDDRTAAKPPHGRAKQSAAETAGLPAETGLLSPTGRGDLWPPVVIGGLALFVLIVAHLMGAPGLFPHVRLDETLTIPTWGMRFAELLRTLILLAFWAGCGLAGLFALGVMFERPLGDARLAALRMAGVVATIRLATLIVLPGPRWVEWMTEAVIQACAFIVLASLFFGLALRNAAILAAWTLLAIITLWLFSFAVQWAMTGGALA